MSIHTAGGGIGLKVNAHVTIPTRVYDAAKTDRERRRFSDVVTRLLEAHYFGEQRAEVLELEAQHIRGIADQERERRHDAEQQVQTIATQRLTEWTNAAPRNRHGDPRLQAYYRCEGRGLHDILGSDTVLEIIDAVFEAEKKYDQEEMPKR